MLIFLSSHEKHSEMRQLSIFYFKNLIYIAVHVNIFTADKRERGRNLTRIFSNPHIKLYKIEIV